MSHCDDPAVPRISSIPGPRGATGAAGAPGAAAAAGQNAFTTTTAAFVMPSAGNTVTVPVSSTAWVANGQTVFIEGAGYFTATVLSPVSLSATALAVPTNTAAGVSIASGAKVSPGGVVYIPTDALDDLADRITVLENTPNGVRTFRSQSPPLGAMRIGDVWYQTNVSGLVIARFRWDGTGWISVDDAGVTGLTAGLANLTTGVNIVTSKVDALRQEYVLAVVGSGTSARVAGFRVAVPGSGPTEFVIQADKFVILGADGTGRASPFFVDGGLTFIDNAHIKDLRAENIAVGENFQAINIGSGSRLFHPSITPRRYFRTVEFGTSFADGKVFGAGNALSGAYAGITPVRAFAPGNAGWTSGGFTICPDAENKCRVHIQGRLIGYTGAILLYVQVNNTTPQPLAARSSSDGGNSTIDAHRILTGISIADEVKFYVAPADGAGVIVPATCRYEIDVTAYNW